MKKQNKVSKGPGSGLEDINKMSKENYKKEAGFPGNENNAAGKKKKAENDKKKK